MEMLLDLAMTFWQWTVFAVLVVIGFIFTKFDGQGEHRVGFKYSEMPHMKPLPIQTKDKGFFKGIWMWLMGVFQPMKGLSWRCRSNRHHYYLKNSCLAG